MDFIKTRFKGLVVYKGKSFRDNRGFFREVFLNKIVKKELPFLSLSYSKKTF